MFKRVVNVNRDTGIISSEVTLTRALLGCGVAAGPLFSSDLRDSNENDLRTWHHSGRITATRKLCRAISL
jgi:hypothetical protein